MDCFSNKSQFFFHRFGPFLKLVYLSIGLWSFITSHSVLCMCVLCGRRWGNVLTLNVRGPSYLCLIRSISWLLMPWLLTSPGYQQPWYWLLHILYCINGLAHDFWTRAGGWEFDRSHGAGTSSPSHWQQVEEQAPKPVGWTMCFLLMTLVPVQKFCINIYVYIYVCTSLYEFCYRSYIQRECHSVLAKLHPFTFYRTISGECAVLGWMPLFVFFGLPIVSCSLIKI